MRCIHREDGICPTCRALIGPEPELQIVPAVPEKNERDRVPIEIIEGILGDLPDEPADDCPPTIN